MLVCSCARVLECSCARVLAYSSVYLLQLVFNRADFQRNIIFLLCCLAIVVIQSLEIHFSLWFANLLLYALSPS